MGNLLTAMNKLSEFVRIKLLVIYKPVCMDLRCLRRHDHIMPGADLCRVWHHLNGMQLIASIFQLLIYTIKVSQTLWSYLFQVRTLRDSQPRLFYWLGRFVPVPV